MPEPSIRLKDLLQKLKDIQCPAQFANRVVKTISCDSREEQKDGLFVALPGIKANGEDFIREAISRGAKAVVVRREALADVPKEVALIHVDDPQQFLRHAALAFYHQPSSAVHTIGVTGTNGKTTITYVLESIIHSAGQQCGVVGTVNCRIGPSALPSKNTTPGFLDNQRFLAQLMAQRVGYCVMEVSSHALAQRRVDGIDFAAAVFTNLTQDHLDYHATMEDYFLAKSLLFTRLRPTAPAVINVDDPYGQRLLSMAAGNVVSYGIDSKADYQAQAVEYGLAGTRFELRLPGGTLPLCTPLVGKHNVYNIVAAAACADSLGLPTQAVVEGIAALKAVPGRLEAVPHHKDFFVFIDYAHTEDGLVNVLKALRRVTQNRIIVVFGCGGDRDRGKRPKMGRAASELADYCVITSDNPRSEDPVQIIKEIESGCTRSNYEICVDRSEAIARALKLARKNEIILLAGKGHETTQILKDRTVAFDERQVAGALLNV